MTDLADLSLFDATLQQGTDDEIFSWSGFCKHANVVPCASIQARAKHNQWARASKKSRSGILSRRIEWRNSLWPQRFWCPLSRQPARKSPPNLFSISSQSRPRSMLNLPRPKANTTDIQAGQGFGSAPANTDGRALRAVMDRPDPAAHQVHATSLWSNDIASATVSMPCCCNACAETWSGSRIPAETDNRSVPCQKPLLSLLSARPSPWPHVPVRRQSLNPRQCPRPLSWSQAATKAEAIEYTGQADMSGPYTATATLNHGGQSC